MFTGIGAVSLASYVDPTKPRLQPERPTQVDLPEYPTTNNDIPTDWTTETTRPNFRQKYTQLKRPSDISGQLLHDFNFDISPPCPIQELVPLDHNNRSYLPKLGSEDETILAEPTQKTQAAFTPRHMELSYDNDIIYRTVCKAKLPEGMERIRLANCRNFFGALEGMSEHWETDLDHYFIAGQEDDQDLTGFETNLSTPPSSGGEEMNHSNPIAPEVAPIPGAAALNGLFNRFKGMVPNTILEKTPAPTSDCGPTDRMPTFPKSVPTMSLGAHLRSAGLPPSRTLSSDSMASDTSSEADIPIPMYRGRRISSGVKMPGLYRTETVKGFLEAAVYGFNCKLSLPRAPASLLVGGVRVPVRHQTFLVHRIPSKMDVARQGIVEGPVMGSFVRQDIEAFGEGTPQQRKEKLQLDLLKEMGCLLHIAQERRREGKQERVWTKQPPKAGHWFSEMASDKSRPDDDDIENEKADAMARRRKKVKTKYETWKEMQPQRPLWDPKVKYMAIGKDEGSDWDEVYMVSSMYHHVSLVRLRVHGAYMDYLADGTLPNPLPADGKWCQPQMQRSQWFDLFDITQRVDAFRCLWGIMCYLTRPASEATN